MTLDEEFSAVAAAIAVLRGDRANERADVAEVRWLMVRLPAFEDLVSEAVDEARHSAYEGAFRLWEWLALDSTPPEWDEAEISEARLVVACMCASPFASRDAAGLRVRLLHLAAQRWADRLTAELRSADEGVWRRALGKRYESVHAHYAPRSKWRTHGLAEVLASDARTVEDVRNRLAHWFGAGCDFGALPAELEAAFAETRTPPFLA